MLIFYGKFKIHLKKTVRYYFFDFYKNNGSQPLSLIRLWSRAYFIYADYQKKCRG